MWLRMRAEDSEAEAKYNSNELKGISAVYGVDYKYQNYLYGRRFTVVTDNTTIM